MSFPIIMIIIKKNPTGKKILDNVEQTKPPGGPGGPDFNIHKDAVEIPQRQCI